MEPAAITRLLARHSAGEPGAEAELAPLVYAELHAIAERQMRGEREGHSLTPTALVHEAWLRLMPGDLPVLQGRRDFFALAARRMRQVLVDHARRRDADKRGAGQRALTLDGLAEPVAAATPVDVLALEQALSELEAMDPRKARVVELRWYGGLELAEVAEILAVSRATVQRDWEVARAFLHLRLK